MPFFDQVASTAGASGAGKTTFMDVIAGRKNQGRISGDIRVNGYPRVRLEFVFSAIHAGSFLHLTHCFLA
jgi:ABC-type multidrug transport system ATPase subunit